MKLAVADPSLGLLSARVPLEAWGAPRSMLITPFEVLGVGKYNRGSGSGGWFAFKHARVVDRHYVGVDASHADGGLYRLSIDRCTGHVVDARLVRGAPLRARPDIDRYDDWRARPNAWPVRPYVRPYAWRWRRDQFTWTTRSTQLLESRLLKLGGPLFHLGLLMVIGGHVLGILVPASVTEWLGVSEHTYHVISVVMGSASSVAPL